MREAGLTLNRNAIPFDPNGPWYTSGIRVGTPAMTTLGMGTNEMKEIADIIYTVLATRNQHSSKDRATKQSSMHCGTAALAHAAAEQKPYSKASHYMPN